MKLLSITLSVVLVCMASGCESKPGANYDLVELLPVSGTVTLDGEAISNAVVTFEEVEQGTFAYGMTNAEGYYELQLDSEMPGCTPGEKKVQISTTRKILGLNASEGGGEAPEGEGEGEFKTKSVKERIPKRYNKQTKLTVEVNEDSITHDFHLTSK